MFRDLLSRWVWTGCLIRMVQRQGRRGICRPVRTTFLYSESSAKIGQCDYGVICIFMIINYIRSREKESNEIIQNERASYESA